MCNQLSGCESAKSRGVEKQVENSQDRQKGSAKPSKSGIEKSLTDEASPLASQGTGDTSGVRAAESDDSKRLAPREEEQQLKEGIVEMLRVIGATEESTKLTVAGLKELTLANGPSCWPKKKNGAPMVSISKIEALRAAHAALRAVGEEGSGHARLPASATAPAPAPAPALKLTELEIVTLSLQNRAATIVKRAVECSAHNWRVLPFTCAKLALLSAFHFTC